MFSLYWPYQTIKEMFASLLLCPISNQIFSVLRIQSIDLVVKFFSVWYSVTYVTIICFGIGPLPRVSTGTED